MENKKLKLKIQNFKNLFHLSEAILANIYYGFPSKKLKVIGVTGTDGKTTTTHLIYHILKSAGKKASVISTVYTKVGNQETDTGLHTTTPRSLLIQELLKLAVDHGDEYFILETTSHALDQNRVWGVNYYTSVLTNITHEHLDYHKNYNDYLKAKTKLLLSSKIAVINRDDQSFNRLSKTLKEKNVKTLTYGFQHKSDFYIDFKQNLTDFNQFNYLAAYSVCKVLGLSDQSILKAIKSFELPKGRLDIVYDKDFKIIIDFAHTPNAIANVLKSVKNNYFGKKGRLIHVFGSAGLRDATKRPLMGEASAKYADVIILTEEDCRTEDVNDIINQIEKGIPKKFKVLKIQDRQEAINKAISLVKEGDVVILTGKGHEKSLCRGRIEYSWDEYGAVEKALKFLI